MSSNHRDIQRLCEQLDRARTDLPLPVAAAVSGGGDSVALLHLLRVAGWTPAELCVVHIDHGRRPESADEARFVQLLSQRFGLECLTERLPDGGPSSAAALRSARYDAMRRLARQAGAQTIALAHTLDDQQETRLLAMLRGAGLRGLAGMRPRSRDLWRPLLGVTRQQLRAWLRSEGGEWIDEPTNVDFTHLRSRLRHLVLPSVGRNVGPAEAFRVTMLQQEDAFLDRCARQAAAWRPFGVFDLMMFRRLEPVLQRRLLRQWVGPGQGAERLEALRNVMSRPDASRVRRVEMAGGRLVLIGAGTAVQCPRPPERTDTGGLVRCWPGIGRLCLETRVPPETTISTAMEHDVHGSIPTEVPAPLRMVWPVVVIGDRGVVPEIDLRHSTHDAAGGIGDLRWWWAAET